MAELPAATAEACQLGVSSVNIRKSSFLWKISNFDRLKYRFERDCTPLNIYGMPAYIEDLLKSPSFSVTPDDFQWRLVMFSARNLVTGSPFLCFEFRPDDDPKSFSVDVVLTISILKSNDKVFTKTTNCCIKRMQLGDKFETLGRGFNLGFIDINYLFRAGSCCLINDELHVLCEYELIHDYQNSRTLTFKSLDSVNNDFVLKLEKRWKNEDFCDFHFVAPCGRKLHAHQLVLTARSPVFYAMLKSNAKDKRDGSVKVTDLSYEVLQEMLSFMYCGKIEKLHHELVGGLLSAAKKYQINDLKDVCKKFLFNNLSTENAMQTFKFCKVFDMEDLQSYVNAFIKSNAKKIYFQNVGNGDETDTYVKEIQDMAEKIQLKN